MPSAVMPEDLAREPPMSLRLARAMVARLEAKLGKARKVTEAIEVNLDDPDPNIFVILLRFLT